MKNNKHKTYLMYGKHAVLAALANKNRKIHKIFCSEENLKLIPEEYNKITKLVCFKELEELLPKDSIHQGISIEVSKLNYNMIENHKFTDNSKFAILDQITDPHNLGAILRSAAAFNIDALILPIDNSAEETSVVAKSACGALELIPIYRVVNLANTMKYLKKQGFWIIGLDGNANENMDKKHFAGRTCLVLGAEGKGMRRLTKENCDLLVKINISSKMESLNASVAASIAFYESSNYS